MIIRILLLAGLAATGWLVFLRRTRLPFHIVIVFALLVVAAIAVIFPDITAEAAQLVGVGRGSDLVTYMVEVGTLFVLLHYYTKFVELERRMTDIVRELAILRSEIDRASSASGVAPSADPAPGPADASAPPS